MTLELGGNAVPLGTEVFGRLLCFHTAVFQRRTVFFVLLRKLSALCLKLLLQQQPVARDLRQISAALKMITDMERIGDQAEDIAEIVAFLGGRGTENSELLRDMARSTIRMVSGSVDAYVKHSEFFRECRNKKWREDEMRVANWGYDKASDEYTCPEGRALAFVGESSRVSGLGYESTVRVYECEDCSGCTRRAKCSKSADPDSPRKIQVNPTLNAFRSRASEMLRTETGSALRKRRSVDVETVFGDIKRNLGFTRFTLRGLEKVTLEWRLVATGHNIRKLFLAGRKKGKGAEGAMA